MRNTFQLNSVSSNSFISYASLLIILDFECYCQADNLLLVLYNTINSNKNLKYVTKIILTHTYLPFKNDNLKFQKKIGRKKLNFQLNREKEMKSLRPRFNSDEGHARRDISKMMFFKDYKTVENKAESKVKATRIVPEFIAPKYERTKVADKYLTQENINFTLIDNSILVEFRKLGHLEGTTAFESFLTQLHNLGVRVSVQQMTANILDKRDKWFIYSEIGHFETTSTMGCYIFNINPALAIVFNHISFNNLTMRDASINDIERLKNTYIKKKIPLLILKDGSAEEVKRTMNAVEKLEFKNLKQLYVTVMSHGDEGDIIYTKTDTYNIKETVLNPLLANESLKDVQKIVLVNACRGDIDPRYEDDDLEYEETNTDEIDENLVTFYSTQKGYVSLLPADGAVFIKEFCEHFDIPFKESSMEEIAERMETVLRKKMDFCEKVTDYCAKPGVLHNIKMEFKNLKGYKGLHKRISQVIDNVSSKSDDTVPAEDTRLIRCQHSD
ncbi:uncharacterized protein LOC119683477 [Teleopsis dalmanni]|uniref:uncharacterized protein LOC119683477 n=1 Tax=Teleopsis dalmanni TaxID=139649 RepID=UPI0018CF7898|nr:uncharacterized protein LOC119683477 [Teleopsis dalmanni]